MSAKGRTVQVRVSEVAKKAVQKHADEILKTKGINMSWGDALLDMLSQYRPDLVLDAMREEDESGEES